MSCNKIDYSSFRLLSTFETVVLSLATVLFLAFMVSVGGLFILVAWSGLSLLLSATLLGLRRRPSGQK